MQARHQGRAGVTGGVVHAVCDELEQRLFLIELAALPLDLCQRVEDTLGGHTEVSEQLC